jgi:hypothetical protein
MYELKFMIFRETSGFERLKFIDLLWPTLMIVCYSSTESAKCKCKFDGYHVGISETKSVGKTQDPAARIGN